MKQTRDMLVRHFSLEDLRDLAFQMGIFPDTFPQTLSPFARELVLYVVRNEMWGRLLREGKVMRPSIDWSGVEAHANREAGNVPEHSAGGSQAQADPNPLPLPIVVDFQVHAARLIDLIASLPDWETAAERQDWVVLHGLRLMGQGVDFGGTRREAASRLITAILLFETSDPGFVAESFAAIYSAIIDSGLLSAPKRRLLTREAQTLRNWANNLPDAG